VKILKKLVEILAYGVIAVRTWKKLKQAEDQLRYYEKKYFILADNALDGIYIISPEGFEYVNPAFEKICGYREKEVLGKDFNFIDLIHPEDRELILERKEARERGKELPTMYEFRIITKDRNIRHVEVNTVPLPGNRARVLGILRDITQRKIAEEEVNYTMEMLRKAMGGTIQAISRIIEMRDPYTSGHQRRVADLARAIATEMGLPKDKIDGIRMAALIHDIGKISVPAEILSKPGRLNKMEFKMIKSHPKTGYEILKRVEFPWPIAQIILQHHERIDGSGYPSGLQDKEILIEAKIIGVADIIEAMSSHRPYRPALGIDKALEEISKNRGVLYDPKVVDACLKLFMEKGFKFEQEE